MRRIREILRLKFEAGLSQRAIARALGVSNSTVSEAFSRLGEAGLAWPLPEGLTDAELEKRLYRARGQAVANPREPDWALVHRKLTGKYVTLRLAWEEYLDACPGGYGYSWFCESYRIWQKRIDVVMRQEHKAGEKLFVDWAGKTLPYLDAESGEVRGAHLFLAVLGASNYTYAEVFENERMESFLTAHVHAFEFLGGAPELIVPDNLRREQRRVDVEDQAAGRLAELPGAGSGRGAGLPHAREHLLIEALHAAVGGGVRGDRPEEQALVVPERAQVGEAVAAVGEHHGEVAHHAPGLVAHLAGMAAQGRAQRGAEPQLVGQSAEQDGAGARGQGELLRAHFNAGQRHGSVHLHGDPPERGLRVSSTRIIPAREDL